MKDALIFEDDNFCFRHYTSYALGKDAHSAHSHNLYEIIYFLDGDATHVIEDRKYKLKSGDFILIKPGKHHFIQIDSTCDYERFNILFSPELLGIEGIYRLSDDFEVINLTDNPRADDIIRKMDYYFKHLDSPSFVKITANLLEELFFLLSISSAPVKSYSPAESSQVLSLAISYINSHLSTIKDISEVAAHCFVTESYLFRLFKHELHHTPKKYITEKRLLLADKRIASGEKPTFVYDKCGFTDYATFYRNYVSYFGKKPSAG